MRNSTITSHEVLEQKVISLLESCFKRLPNSLKSEHHVVAEIYHQLKTSIMSFGADEVILEEPYPAEGTKKCDLVLMYQGLQVWVEVKGYFKSETAETRSRKHGKYESSPIQSVSKLAGLTEEMVKVLMIYQNVEFSPRKLSWDRVAKHCNEMGVHYLHERF